MKNEDDELTDEQFESNKPVISEINQEVKKEHQWLDEQGNQQANPSRGDEYLQEMGEAVRSSLRFVGGGDQANGELLLDIGLSAELKNRIVNEDWRGEHVCLLVGKNREGRGKSSHWVAVKPEDWPTMKIDNDTIEGIWDNKKLGKFSFVISKEFVKNFRRVTTKNNQKLFLKVRFGVRATAGKIWIKPN